MVRAIGDQVEKNPEYLSILDKKAIKNEKIDDDVQKEQVSVMNKLLNDTLRAKGYAGADIKMVLTDVKDPNGPFYTDTLTNVVVFDRKQLANLDRDKILNILGHEFGHYSKEDNKTGTQTIANYSGDKLEDRTKAMVAKEATEETLASIRNNPNVITGDEGKKLAESIPMERREYYKALMFNISATKLIVGAGIEAGVIYNKDPITGKEEFGYVLGGKGLFGFDYNAKKINDIGKVALKVDWGFDSRGILADIGVSSLQLDKNERGFGLKSENLDMRMDTRAKFSAYDVVNSYSAHELERIFEGYGELPSPAKFAAKIVEARQNGEIKSAERLAQIIGLKGVNGRSVSAATLAFQAIRIEVNNELGELQNLLQSIEDSQIDECVVAIIGFHSLEDRIVKNKFKQWAQSCICPPQALKCTCGGDNALGKIVSKKAITPSAAEVKANPRSSCAKMRIFKISRGKNAR